MPDTSSTKPYLIRAIYEWCNDNGFTPYLAVAVDERTQVPREHVKGGEIVLNVSPMATNRLSLGNDLIAFQARFGGLARELSIPVENVTAIYARENGHGMAFDVPKAMAVAEPAADPAQPAAPAAAPPPALPRPIALAPARAPVLDAGAPAPASDAATGTQAPEGDPTDAGPPDAGPPEGAPRGGRPKLTRVK
jgi:stringent starvation protein B